MSDEIASSELQRLLGINKSALSEFAQDGIVVRGEKRGTYKLEAGLNSVAHHKIPHSCGLTEKPQLAWPGVVLWGLR
jgi:hypothetical protein